MTNATTSYQNRDHRYEFTAVEPLETNLVTVVSDSYEAIEDFLSTLELAGPEEGTELPDLIEMMPDGPQELYFVEVSRATVSLFLDFDVRYYL